ncbi:hypothetical protein [Spirosoma areae]
MPLKPTESELIATTIAYGLMAVGSIVALVIIIGVNWPKIKALFS